MVDQTKVEISEAKAVELEKKVGWIGLGVMSSIFMEEERRSCDSQNALERVRSPNPQFPLPVALPHPGSPRPHLRSILPRPEGNYPISP